MALELKHNISSSKTAILAFDVIGAFDAVDNLTGWNAPNKTTAEIDRAEIIVTIPNNITPVTIDVFPTFPTIDDELEFEITAIDLGLEDIRSGIYLTEYKVFDDDTQEEFSHKLCSLLTCDIQCDIDKLAAGIDVSNLQDPETIAILHLQNILEAAHFAACCGKKEKAQRLIDFLYNQVSCPC